MKIPNDIIGNRTRDFVAQCLNQLGHRVPLSVWGESLVLTALYAIKGVEPDSWQRGEWLLSAACRRKSRSVK